LRSKVAKEGLKKNVSLKKESNPAAPGAPPAGRMRPRKNEKEIGGEREDYAEGGGAKTKKETPLSFRGRLVITKRESDTVKRGGHLQE